MQTSSLIDSHCHLHSLDLSFFNNNLDEVMRKANDAGVSEMLCVCLNFSDLPRLHEIANSYTNVYTSIGIHPNEQILTEPDCNEIIKLASHPSCIAVGETGLDYYRLALEQDKPKQQKRFREHIRAALALGKPLIIHTRDSALDTLKILKEEEADKIGGVMHCFTETLDIALKAIELNFYISISGIVTFKNALQIQEVAKTLPLSTLLIETDSPYLAPVPFRGKQNHPALVKNVAEKIAQIREISLAEVAKQTAQNFYDCFKVKTKKRVR